MGAPGPHTGVWDDATVELLKGGVREGLSYSQIARLIGRGCTRNGALGKAHRLGITGDRRSALKATRSLSAVSVRAARRTAPPPPKAPPRPPRVSMKDRKPTGLLVSLLDLAPGMCRFPFGHPGREGFGFCGEAVEVGKSYCPTCMAVATEPPKTTAKQLHRSLRRVA